MFVVPDIPNMGKSFEQKLESQLSNIENIGNEKSQIRQIPITKIRLCDFRFSISEIGYCVS